MVLQISMHLLPKVKLKNSPFIRATTMTVISWALLWPVGLCNRVQDGKCVPLPTPQLGKISLTHTHPCPTLPSPTLIPHSHFPLLHSPSQQYAFPQLPVIFLIITIADSLISVRFLHRSSNITSFFTKLKLTSSWQSHFYVGLYVNLVSYANCNLSVKLNAAGPWRKSRLSTEVSHSCDRRSSAVRPASENVLWDGVPVVGTDSMADTLTVASFGQMPGFWCQ